MKNLSLLIFVSILTTTSGLTTFAQNEKCLAFSNTIVINIKGKIQCQGLDENDVYYIKAQSPTSYDFETIKTICDTTTKNTKVSFNWRLNYDKNHEKEYSINGKKVLITFYQNDNFLYFEFPKE